MQHEINIYDIQCMKKRFRHGVNSTPEGDGCETCGEIRAYNQAIQDVLDYIKTGNTP